MATYDLKEICDRLKYLGSQAETPEARAEVEAAFAMKWDGVQCVAARVLGKWGGRRSVELLKQWLLNNYRREHGFSYSVENVATYVLMECYEVQDIPWILDIYASERNLLWFGVLTKSLSSKKVHGWIVAELEHPDASHRRNALEVVLKLHLGDACEIFEKMLLDPVLEVSSFAFVSLRKMCPDSEVGRYKAHG